MLGQGSPSDYSSILVTGNVMNKAKAPGPDYIAVQGEREEATRRCTESEGALSAKGTVYAPAALHTVEHVLPGAHLVPEGEARL